ncbi:dentin sialophosphoprotein-like [Sitodiplosis mosellana]|uniref:dentin sialophosphoprotein-like n=1 Tax=Sitodiplosis mosellana TaxID=263140 RepID=UPI00244423D5|nr:dentin sialophosphoprotein-like [Sitodiplosis mosellana]
MVEEIIQNTLFSNSGERCPSCNARLLGRRMQRVFDTQSFPPGRRSDRLNAIDEAMPHDDDTTDDSSDEAVKGLDGVKLNETTKSNAHQNDSSSSGTQTDSNLQEKQSVSASSVRQSVESNVDDDQSALAAEIDASVGPGSNQQGKGHSSAVENLSASKEDATASNDINSNRNAESNATDKAKQRDYDVNAMNGGNLNASTQSNVHQDTSSSSTTQIDTYLEGEQNILEKSVAAAAESNGEKEKSALAGEMDTQQEETGSVGADDASPLPALNDTMASSTSAQKNVDAISVIDTNITSSGQTEKKMSSQQFQIAKHESHQKDHQRSVRVVRKI